MIDHVKLFVEDIRRSRAFYTAALAPLGYRALMGRDGRTIAFGRDYPHFWIEIGERCSRSAVALRAPDAEAVGGFHAAALTAGGRDAAAPTPTGDGGLRAVITDPDGNDITAVCPGPQGGPAR